MIRGEGFGMHITGPISGEKLHIAGFSFVDDTDVVQTASDSESREELLQKTQQSLNLWEGGLRTTGGALVPSKSDWTLVDFEVKEGEWQYTQRDQNEKLSVRDEKGERYNLKQLSTATGRLTLGVYISGDGNWKDEIDYLTQMSKDWAEKVRVGQIQRHDAWMAFRLTIRKSLDYCLQATYLTKRELRKIHSAALCRGLSASGIVNTMDRTICYAPVKYQGLGLQDPYVKQGIEHVKMIMQQMDTPSISGKLLKFTIEGIKVECGLTGSLFSHNFHRYGCLATTSWVKATWQFLWEYNIQLDENSPSQPLLRLQDRPLIYDIMEAARWNTEEIKCIKKCMLYLDLFSRSDITCAKGTHIRPDCFLTQYLPHSKRSPIANTPCIWPDSKDTKLWHNILLRTYKLHNIYAKLPFHLGSWSSLGRSLWIWFYSQEDNRVFCRNSYNTFDVYTIQLTSSRRSSRLFNKSFIKTTSTLQVLPISAKEATVYSKNNPQQVFLHSFHHHDSDTFHSDTTPLTPNYTIEESFAALLPHNLRWILHHNIIPGDKGRALAKQLRKSAVLCIADGSYKDHYGTAAFILDANEDKNSWLGVLPCYGDPSFHDAYRSELTGLLAIVTILLAICNKYDIQDGIVHIGCDNDTALARCLDEEWKCKCPDENWDIIQGTRHIISQLPLSLFPVMVTGHLDKNISYVDLNRKEQLNVDCDTLAKLWWKQTHINPQIFNGRLPGECTELHIQGVAIKQHLDESIFSHCSRPAILQTWQRRRNMSTQAQISIDWNLVHTAMKRIPHARRLFVVKHISNRSATGIQMQRRQARNNDNCPRCQQPHENNDHIMQCQHVEAQEQWTQSLLTMDLHLSRLQAPPHLCNAITSLLNSWRNKTSFTVNPAWDTVTSSLIQAQQIIGGKLTLEGCIHSSWKDILHQYLSGLSSKVNGERFVTSIIKHLWQIAWDMWDNRNKALHESEANATLLGITALNTQLVTMYQKGILPLMTPDEKALFKSPLESLLRLRPPSKRAWIATVEASYSLCRLRHNSFMPRERDFMTTFLGRTVQRN